MLKALTATVTSRWRVADELGGLVLPW